eukprot:6536796-Pyramimonas_sp.AAC.1
MTFQWPQWPSLARRRAPGRLAMAPPKYICLVDLCMPTPPPPHPPPPSSPAPLPSSSGECMQL